VEAIFYFPQLKECCSCFHCWSQEHFITVFNTFLLMRNTVLQSASMV